MAVSDVTHHVLAFGVHNLDLLVVHHSPTLLDPFASIMASSSSSSPEITSVVSPETQRRFSYKDANHEEVLEDLSRHAYPYHSPRQSSCSFQSLYFESSR